jgi:ABC-type glutathione transport system ATPase component
MSSKENNGILVDQAVHEQCRGRYTFKSLPPVKAKGYEKPVPILEPILDSNHTTKKRKSPMTFVGRIVEKRAIFSIAKNVEEDLLASKGTMIFLTGESGMGKSALAVHVMESMKKQSIDEKSITAMSRSNSTETEHRIPLRYVVLSTERNRSLFKI